MECNIENFKKLLDEGYSFRFNSLLPEDKVYFLDKEKIKSLGFPNPDFKLATVGYEHTYLANFLEFGLDEGFKKNEIYFKEKLDELIDKFNYKYELYRFTN